jgi:hypothetical protein
MSSRAQSSVELLLILVVSLILLAVLVSFTTEHVTRVQKEQSLHAATQSVNRLAREIDAVYFSGPGHVREVVVSFPSGIDPALSRLENNAIILHMYGTDVIGTTTPTLQGTVPTSAGLIRIRLISYVDHVTISLVSILSDQDSIYLAMSRDSNDSVNVTFTNYSGYAADVNYSLTWTHTLVGASLSTSGTTLSSGSSSSVTLSFSASGTSIGNYVGFLHVSSVVNGSTETLAIPVNVEVFSASQTLLTVIPSSITATMMADDTNTTTIRVCNAGSTPLKTISFTPSTNAPGSWISALSSIAQLDGSACQDVDVTFSPPAGTSTGSYTGSLSVTDYTGANSTILGVNTRVTTMKDYFTWNWASARTNNESLYNFSIQNTSLQSPVIIDQLAINAWQACDVEQSVLTDVTFNSQSVFTGGSANDGNTVNITNFSLTANTAYASGNELLFSDDISNDGEQFQPIVTFSDGSVYTGSTHGDGCVLDITSPGTPSSFSASAGSSAESILLSFAFPGDDNQTGSVSSVAIRYASSDITTQAAFDAATAVTYTGSILAAGNSGTQFVDDLNVGTTYYFSIQFSDEAGNDSNLPTAAPARPRNTFQYSLNDFNVSPFVYSRPSPSTGEWDVNVFTLQNFSISSGDRNVYLRVTDDGNTSNNWYAALGFSTTRLTSVRIWYPSPSTAGLPGTTPQYSGNPSAPIATNIDMLSASIFPTSYRFNGDLVTFPNPTTLYVELFQGFSDMNATIDQSVT